MKMNAKVAKAYANNEVESSVISSDSKELVVLVYERVLDNLKIGKCALENGEYGVEAFAKANDLIQQGLLACLDYSAGQDIAINLGAIYEWSLREMVNGRIEKSPQKIQEVIEVLTPLYEAWLSLAPKAQLHNGQAERFIKKTVQPTNLSVVNA